MSDEFYLKLNRELTDLENKGNLRRLRNLGVRNGNHLFIDGRNYLNLSSNDYLGITSNIHVLKEFYNTISNDIENQFSPGSTGSRLLSGNHYLYNKVELQLTELFKEEGSKNDILIFNSGYHANLGILQAIATNKDLILSDKLNHASIIDGFRITGADFIRYRHLDYDQLEEILVNKRKDFENVFIISESLFSMDGDLADLNKLSAIKKKHNAVLYIDEAHAFGVFGPKGLGLTVKDEVLNEIDIVVGTFGKAIGGLGAYALVKPVLRSYLINKMRPLIFSTALPPVMLNWIHFALNKMIEMDGERKHLAKISSEFRNKIINAGGRTLGASQIVPLITGSNESALDLSAKLRREGYIAMPVRPPSVPPNTARIRFSLSASLTDSDMSELSDTVIREL